jgi:hypothetical protein
MIVPRCASPEFSAVNTRFLKSPIESLSLRRVEGRVEEHIEDKFPIGLI